MKANFLKHKNKVGSEIRPLYFYQSFKKPVLDARIISFGSCNFNCPYCKRNGCFRDDKGNIINSVSKDIKDIFRICNDAILKNQVVRLSGGDPVMFQTESLLIFKYIKEHKGKSSIAHNGSSPEFAKQFGKYVESAAIDIKGPERYFYKVTNLPKSAAKKMYQNSLKTIQVLLKEKVLVDIRTPIFGFTTLEDLKNIANDINSLKGKTKFWTLRLYKPVEGCSFGVPKQEKILKIIPQIKKLYPNLKIGLRAKWEPSGFLYF